MSTRVLALATVGAVIYLFVTTAGQIIITMANQLAIALSR